MNSDILATYYTLFLIVTKIIIASRGEPIEGIMYFIYGIWTLIFWGNMRVIADAITGKKYIEGSSRSGGRYKISKGNSPIAYNVKLLISVAFCGFSAAVIFDFYKFQ